MPVHYLHLEDGTVLSGKQFGFDGETQGEVVFSTGMTGYPQSLTDPSFAGQILVFTYPLMGNYGVPKKKMQGTHLVHNFESEKIWPKGVVIADYCDVPSHYQSAISLSQWFMMHKVPALCGIDTRELTQKIRDKGVMKGKISHTKTSVRWSKTSPEAYVPEVSTKKSMVYSPKKSNGKHIVILDCGVKHGILRSFLDKGYKVTRIPWDSDPLEVSRIDGVVVSNGPGDPKQCGKTIANIKRTVEKGIPFLGVCLGHQLLALAIGADTYKLKYGHRGLNQPCLDLGSQKAYVTSQNHGYAVKRDTIPRGFEEWFINLNDGTNEGLRHKTKKIWSTQFHPEGSPGPFDTDWIFSFI